MSYTLPLQGSVPLPNPLAMGRAVNFRSQTVDVSPDPKPQIDNVSLNILSSDGDFLLHISFRRSEDAIVFNSRYASGSWGKEERTRLRGVFDRGKGATVTVNDTGPTFRISINNSLIHSYKKRISLSATTVSYSMNSDGIIPMFAREIAVDMRHSPPTSYQQAYFPLTAADVAKETDPFDIVIIGSGVGGGVLAVDLLEKNQLLKGSQSFFTPASTPPVVRMPSNRARQEKTPEDKSLRILVIERGGLLFTTHALNGPRPTYLGPYGQINEYFYNEFKDQFDMDKSTAATWQGGPLYSLGGRSTVWSLFTPRISPDTFQAHFPPSVSNDLMGKYYLKAEEKMRVGVPATLPLHRALIDELNLRPKDPTLPIPQWERGRIASEFNVPQNFNFPQGAFSPVDRLVEEAMNDPKGEGKFKTILNSQVSRLEPAPKPGRLQKLTHVVVKEGDTEYKIKCNKAVICAGSVESAAVLLRSAGTKTREDAQALYGGYFACDFGHVTDHRIFVISMPFFYRDMAMNEQVGAMRLGTNITFTDLDQSTALATLYLDQYSFLSRRIAPDPALPELQIVYLLPSTLAPQNTVQLNSEGEPCISVDYAYDQYLEQKKRILVNFAVDAMNKVAAVLNVQFAELKEDKGKSRYRPLPTVTARDLTLEAPGPGYFAHEVGSIPMPDGNGRRGIVDANLKMQYGWDNVYVCDMSVFPYSPAANPTLSMTALSLRLSDTLVSLTNWQPIRVFNLLQKDVFVQMTLSNDSEPNFGPTGRERIPSGESVLWKRVQREVIYVYHCMCSRNYMLQMVYPGINAMIVNSPPVSEKCVCRNARPGVHGG